VRKIKIVKPMNLIFWIIMLVLIIGYMIARNSDDVAKRNINIYYVEMDEIKASKEKFLIREDKDFAIKVVDSIKEKSDFIEVPVVVEEFDGKELVLNYKTDIFSNYKLFNEAIQKTFEDMNLLEKVTLLVNDTVYSAEEKEVSVSLYFVSEENSELVKEDRMVKYFDEKEIPTIIINELIRGSEIEGNISPIPEGSKVNKVELIGKIAYVDLNELFRSNQNLGTDDELLLLYSIVNSLTELEEIEKVQFQIEGKTTDVFVHVDIDEPFERSEEY
jgi:hypothetical protein